MENSDDFVDIQLIDKSFREDVELTEQECSRLEEWLDISQTHRSYYDRSYGAFRKGTGTYLSDRNLRKQYRRLVSLLEISGTRIHAPYHERRRIGKSSLRIAASVAVAVSAAAIYFLLPSDRITVEYSAPESETPDANTASIIIEGHSPVSSENLSAINLAKSGRIVRSGGNTIDYTGVGGRSSAILNTVSVPHGTVYNLILSDGTRVTLNSESSITFPVSFDDRTREISLTGEACMEVSHEAHRPFVVHAAHTDIIVRGTRFVVSSYNDGVVETSLLSGSLSVVNTVNGNETLIRAGQSAASYRNGNILVADVVASDKVSWLQGTFDFENKRIGEIITRLSKWYGIGDVIYYGEDLKERRFTGSFDSGMELTVILELISMASDINFKIDNNTIEIRKNGE